jgi:hypothetical protein
MKKKKKMKCCSTLYMRIQLRLLPIFSCKESTPASDACARLPQKNRNAIQYRIALCWHFTTSGCLYTATLGRLACFRDTAKSTNNVKGRPTTCRLHRDYSKVNPIYDTLTC